MKRVLLLLAAGSLVLSAAGNVKNTKHNLSATSTAYASAPSQETQICKFCHTPHGAAMSTGTGDAMKFARLWGHNGTVLTTFGTPSTDNGAGSTFACLSCHDGSVAINNNTNVVTATNGSIPALGAMNTIAGHIDGTTGLYLNAAQFGDAAMSHPVNKLYNATYIGTRYVDPATWPATGAPRLFSGTAVSTDKYIQCSSCHSVHGDTTITEPGLLRVSNTASGLCLSCHIK